MGYRKIPNLYKEQYILEVFREVYALEKIHGTSAHINFQADLATSSGIANPGKLTLFSGGEKFAKFAKLFATEDEVKDHEQRQAKYIESLKNGGDKVDLNDLWDLKDLASRFEKFGDHSKLEGITVFGEAYGGSQQRMSATYGPDLKFAVFEIKMGENWLDVPTAEKVAISLGFEFVDYAKGPATKEFVDAQRDADSTQAIRNGVGPGKMREGVVLRPVIELTRNDGGRILIKHKRAEFGETKTPREVCPEKLLVLTKAQEIAEEWVVEMRLDHVLDKLKATGANISSMQSTGQVVKAMISDVQVEGEGEMVWSKEVAKAVGRSAAALYKKRVMG